MPALKLRLFARSSCSSQARQVAVRYKGGDRTTSLSHERGCVYPGVLGDR